MQALAVILISSGTINRTTRIIPIIPAQTITPPPSSVVTSTSVNHSSFAPAIRPIRSSTSFVNESNLLQSLEQVTELLSVQRTSVADPQGAAGLFGCPGHREGGSSMRRRRQSCPPSPIYLSFQPVLIAVPSSSTQWSKQGRKTAAFERSRPVFCSGWQIYPLAAHPTKRQGAKQKLIFVPLWATYASPSKIVHTRARVAGR